MTSVKSQQYNDHYDENTFSFLKFKIITIIIKIVCETYNYFSLLREVKVLHPVRPYCKSFIIAITIIGIFVRKQLSKPDQETEPKTEQTSGPKFPNPG